MNDNKLFKRIFAAMAGTMFFIGTGYGVIGLFTATEEQLLAQAQGAYQDNHLENAHKLVDKVLSKHEEEPSAHFLKGNIYRKEGKNQDALRAYEKAESLGYKEGILFEQMALTYAHVQEGEKAEAYFKKSIAKDPKNPVLHNNLAVLYMQLGQWNDALNSLTVAYHLSPNYAETQRNLGYAHDQVSNPETAIAHYKAYLKLRPNAAEKAQLEERIKILEENKPEKK